MKDLRNILAPVLTGFVFIFIVLIMFTTLSFSDHIDESFFVNMSVGLLLMILTTVLWMPKGKDKGKEDKGFLTAQSNYNDKANKIIDEQHQQELKKFCEFKNKEFSTNLLKSKLAKVCISLEFFNKYVEFKRGKSNKDFKEELKSYSQKQIKTMDYLMEHELKFRKLKSEDLLKASPKLKSPSPIDKEKVFNIVMWVGKIVWSLTCFAVIAYIIIKPDASGWLSKIVQLLMWGLTIGANIFTSIQFGYKSIVEYRKNYYIELNSLCLEFFEWANIKVDNKEEQA